MHHGWYATNSMVYSLFTSEDCHYSVLHDFVDFWKLSNKCHMVVQCMELLSVRSSWAYYKESPPPESTRLNLWSFSWTQAGVGIVFLHTMIKPQDSTGQESQNSTKHRSVVCLSSSHHLVLLVLLFMTLPHRPIFEELRPTSTQNNVMLNTFTRGWRFHLAISVW